MPIPPAFAIPVLVILLTGLMGVWIAPEPYFSIRRFAILACGAVVFALFARLSRSSQGVKKAVLLVLLMGLLAAMLSLVATDWREGDLAGSFPALSALASRFPQWITPPGTGVPNPAHGANPRLVAGSMALFLPLALSLALFAPDRKLIVLGALSLPVLFLPLLISQSPQGFLAAVIGIGITLAFLNAAWFLMLAGALGVVLCLWMQRWGWLPDLLAERLDYGVASRLRIWSAAVSMLRDHPLLGIGLNNFPVVFPRYSSYPDAPAHAHNVLLQAALDTGVVGVAALLVLLAAGFAVSWRTFRLSKDAFERAVLPGLAGALAAFAGYGLFDSMTLGNVPAIAVWAVLGILAGGGFACHQPTE